MRVLVLAPQVPWPPRQGTALRNYHITYELAQRHDVTLLAFGNPNAPPGPLESAGVRVTAVPPPPPRPLTTRFLDLGITLTPDLARRLTSPAMRSLVENTVRTATRGDGFDVVQIEGLEMAPYGFVDAVGEGPRRRLIYDAHNAEWVLQHRAWQTDMRRPRGWPGALYSVIQTWKLRRYERRLLGAAHATVAVSEADARALAALAPEATITVVPNGVDTEYFRPEYGPPGGNGKVNADLCVFVGKMDFRPNVDAMTWFCGAVWPHVRARRPTARLAIVGRDPAPRVRNLAAEDIEVTGTVDDVRPWLARSGVVVVPLRVGGGTRLKVLEAMSMGKAIAATTLAVEGLNVRHNREAMLADAPGPLANTIVTLMGDANVRAEMGTQARARAVAEYRWAALVPRIEQLYRADSEAPDVA